MASLPAGLRRAIALVPSAPLSCLRRQPQKQTSLVFGEIKNRFSSIAASLRQPLGRPVAPLRSSLAATARVGFWKAKPFRSASTAAPEPVSSSSSSSSSASPSSSSSSSPSRFPEVSSKGVAIWLIGSAVSVFGIVVLGGLTRLTESGLSITEWRPVTGTLPPLSDADWEAEFAKYRASPEFKRLNSHMTVDEFKKIFFMEWGHRLWGRFIGVAFVVPAAIFVLRRRVAKPLAWQLLGIASLIGFQGFLGWWMVSSGLRDELFAPGAEPPRVSQYRLTAHLATAFLCYSWMLMAGLGVLRDRRLLANPEAATKAAAALSHSGLRPLRRAVTALTALVFVTAMSGALVAGLDAGLIYNEFPRMGTGLTPPRAELWDPAFAHRSDQADLWWRNMLENPSLVQLDHRILATTTFCSVLALFAYARRGHIAALLPANVRKGTTGVLHLALLQVALGICTLIYMVPTHLAATHQAGSLALLTGVLVLGHRLRIPPASLRMVERHLAKGASTATKA